MLWETCLLAQREIRRNVLRSTLTILGIVIGVAAVITMVTLGGGATKMVASDIGKLGSNLLNIRPGQDRGHGGARASAKRFETADAVAMAQQVSGIAAVAPTANATAQAIFGNVNWSTSVTGSTNGFLKVRDWPVATGRPFTGGEVSSGKSVCLLGATVKKELFGGEDPLGATIRLGRIAFKVIGVLSPKGQSSFGGDQDDMVLIPLRTLQRRFKGNKEISAIMVSAQNGVSTETVQADIERLLRERRGIAAGKADDFHVRDMKEIIETLTGATRVLTALLAAVAAVSLLVGGIGIMNIMLVSVTERTREIGTRLAIGALERDVLLQFLVEAVVLSAFGGLVGIALGLTASVVGARLMGIPFVFNAGIVVAAFFFSGAVGVVFGYFPAKKAARLDPIEALRAE
ncbi:MAG: ABC transporter permease [Desulfobacterales bacterium]|nr:ABC transporter permease [Desulfobacterales bacterium]